jgi:hypothetical protein
MRNVGASIDHLTNNSLTADTQDVQLCASRENSCAFGFRVLFDHILQISHGYAHVDKSKDRERSTRFPAAYRNLKSLLLLMRIEDLGESSMQCWDEAS